MKVPSQLSRRKFVSGLMIGFYILAILPSVTAQGTLTLSVSRNVGMAFGNYISGTFALTGSGPDSIQNLTVYFNGEEVHFVEGNTISWQFNTGNYPGGPTNITLVGIDDLGEMYTASTRFVFISGSLTTLIVIFIIVLVAILVLIKYGGKLLHLRTK